MTNNRKHLIVLAVAVSLPILIGYSLSYYPEVFWNHPPFHFYYVALSSLASLLVGYLAYQEYSANGEGKVYLLALGFVGITILYGWHGLITPGKSVITFPDPVSQINAFVFFGDISRLWIGIFLFYQVTVNKQFSHRSDPKLVLAAVALLLFFVSLAALTQPEIFPAVKDPTGRDTHFAILTKVITLVLLGVTCTRYYDVYRIATSASVLSLMISVILIMQTVILFMISRPWGLLWWLAHNLYLFSFLSVGLGFLFCHRHKLGFGFFDVQQELEADIANLTKNYRLLNEAASKDSLTGLANRRHLDQVFRDWRASARDSSSLAVLFLDLDGFKEINDRYGHAIGDQLLVGIAENLKASVREGDIVARLGGDEFIILLPGDAQPEEVENVAQRLLGNLNKPFLIDNHHCRVSASLGISLCPQDSRDLDQLIRKADAAMYQVKNASKNGYAFFSRPNKAS